MHICKYLSFLNKAIAKFDQIKLVVKNKIKWSIEVTKYF